MVAAVVSGERQLPGPQPETSTPTCERPTHPVSTRVVSADRVHHRHVAVTGAQVTDVFPASPLYAGCWAQPPSLPRCHVFSSVRAVACMCSHRLGAGAEACNQRTRAPVTEISQAYLGPVSWLWQHPLMGFIVVA